jgi:hypothetical protein
MWLDHKYKSKVQELTVMRLEALNPTTAIHPHIESRVPHQRPVLFQKSTML